MANTTLGHWDGVIHELGWLGAVSSSERTLNRISFCKQYFSPRHGGGNTNPGKIACVTQALELLLHTTGRAPLRTILRALVFCLEAPESLPPRNKVCLLLLWSLTSSISLYWRSFFLASFQHSPVSVNRHLHLSVTVNSHESMAPMRTASPLSFSIAKLCWSL